MTGWLVNDQLGAIPGSGTFWENLLEWFPDLQDQTGGYTPYHQLRDRIERLYVRSTDPPQYLIRNASFFAPIRSPVPTAAFLQDVLYGDYRQLQIEVCRRAQITVVNSAYTAAQYPELPHPRVIPIGVDAVRFRPCVRPDSSFSKSIPPNAVCFIGSSDRIKGISHIERLLVETPLNFCLVMKDETNIQAPGRLVTFNRVSHEQLAFIINACVVGFCPSIRETQHLAGIEMGLSGLPLITSDVGIYYQRPAGVWGQRVEPDEYGPALEALIAEHRSREAVAAYWRATDCTKEACRRAWATVVEELCRGGQFPSRAASSSTARVTG